MTDLPFDTPCHVRSRPRVYTEKVYLTLSSTGQVINAPLDVYSGLQEWKLVKRADQYFDIINIPTGTIVAAQPPSDKEREYTPSVYGNIKISWDVEWTSVYECRAIMKVPSNTQSIASKVLDLSYDRIVFWEENRQANQHWAWEKIDTIPPAKVRWEVVIGGIFPSSAVQGGNDINDDPLYVTRAVIPMAGEFHCGKGGPHLAQYQYCLIPWGDIERSCPVFEVLVADPGAVVWIACEGSSVDLLSIKNSDGKVMKPVEAGKDYSLYGPYGIYSIRADVEGHTTPGKGTSQRLWIGFDGKERVITGKFEILCYSSSDSDDSD